MIDVEKVLVAKEQRKMLRNIKEGQLRRKGSEDHAHLYVKEYEAQMMEYISLTKLRKKQKKKKTCHQLLAVARVAAKPVSKRGRN